ncbi:MAG: hypothetical protein AAF805_09275 [Planctomycetota bacterium]
MRRSLIVTAATAVLAVASPARSQPAPTPDLTPARAPDAFVQPARYGTAPSGAPPIAADDRDARYRTAGDALASGAAQPASRPLAPPRPLPGVAGAPASGDPGRLTPVGAPRVERARVTKGSGKLPNDAGQVWREYDIRPYTARVPETEGKPQQALVDWVLRETGYEAWHSETFGILNADRERLTVYHTPAMQAIVADIVDRFVNARAAERTFSMRIVTVRNPDWRARALGLMTPIGVQSPGLQAWIIPKENAALLASELAKRGDVREYNAANQVVPHGRSTVFSTMRPRRYTKGIVPTGAAWPGYQPETGELNEGASLEFNPLLSHDLRTAEAVIKLRLHQVEKMRRVSLDLPAPAVPGAPASNQRLQIEVPQLTMANLHERFRWPADQVLLLSMGMVATPGPEQGNAFTEMLPGALKSPPRADALLFVEARGPAAVTPGGAPIGRVNTAGRPATSFSGRY